MRHHRLISLFMPCYLGPNMPGEGIGDRLSAFDDTRPGLLGGGGKDGSQMVAQLIQALSGALVYPDLGNFETNRRLWNKYAEEWTPQADFVSKMAVDVGEDVGAMSHVGDEWSSRADLEEVVRDFILPYLGPEGTGVVAEVGVGGGRVAARVLPHVSLMACFDVSQSMLERATKALSSLVGAREGGGPRLELVLLASPDVPSRFHGAFDFVYCFDVMVHMDLHLIYHYFRQVHAMLKPGANAFFSTANLTAPAGWERFERQSKYTVGGFYFLCPEMVNLLLDKAGFDVVKASSVPPGFNKQGTGENRGNIYYGRDYLVVASKR